MTSDLKIDFRKVMIRAFVNSKRRLPKSLDELAEWLEEFDSELLRSIERTQEAFTEHMMTCVSGYVGRGSR